MELLSKSAARNNTFLTLGKILGPHGIKGALKIFSLNDFPEHLLALERVFVLADPDAEKAQHELKVKHVQHLKGNVFMFFFEEISDRNEAESLSKCFIAIPKAEAPELPEDTFYIDDLLGFAVYDTAGQHLGELTQMVQNQQDLLIVSSPDGKEHWIPFVEELVPEVQLASKRIIVKVIEGLLDL